MHADALSAMVSSFDQAALIEHCMNHTISLPSSDAFTREYAAAISARARELGYSSSRPVVPDVSEVPFTRLQFTGTKGPALIAQYPSKVLWVESISLSSGSKENYFFVQVAADKNSVTLFDRKRDVWVKLMRDRVLFSRGTDDGWSMIYSR